MTENTPEHPSETTATTGTPSQWDRRWDKARRRGGPFRLAAIFVTLAAMVFIIAVIFWSGFILGACVGGHHGGGEHHHRHQGMMQSGLVIEQGSVPSPATV
jgi:hypothetical protein